MNKTIIEVTQRIVDRSKNIRSQYLTQMKALADDKVSRSALSCGNIAHAMASCSDAEKQDLTGEQKVNIGVFTAYNASKLC